MVRTIVVADIGVQSVVADRSSSSLNLIPRVDEITARETKTRRSLVGGLASVQRTPGHRRLGVELARLERTLGGVGAGAWLEAGREAGDDATWATWADWWRLGRVLGLLRVSHGIGTGVWAEVRGLIHVIPEPVDIDTCSRIEKLLELAVPVILSVGVEPVREDSWTGPDSTLVLSTVFADLPYVLLTTFVVDIVVTSPDSGVDHNDVVLLASMKVVHYITDEL